MDSSFVQLITSVCETFERHRVKYAITGSVASSLHGEPITSTDVDYIIEMSVAQVKPVCADLSALYYVSDEGLRDAVINKGMTNVIDGRTGISADLSVVAPSPFHRNVFLRRVQVDLDPGGIKAWFVSPEDIVLMKLNWRKESRSSKQWNDALGVVRANGARLDWQYLFDQARELGIVDDLTELRDEGGV
jgi:hypothetical protein